MYKCEVENCEYTMTDSAMTRKLETKVYKESIKCPRCGSKLLFIDELYIKAEKYKKSMLLQEKNK